MGKKRIILDTNIYVSALGWKGNPEKILRRVIKGEFTLVLSVDQLEEIRRVLDYPKFGFSQKQKERFLLLLQSVAAIVKTRGKLNIIKEDPMDNILLVAANATVAGYIVSGNRHLLRLKKYRKTKIVTAKEFLSY